MTHIHLVVLTIYLFAVGAIASTWWRTRATWTWYALAILAAPLLGALWVLTLSPARHPPASDPTEDTEPGLEEETWPDPRPPINHEREETLDDLLAEEPDDPDHPDDLGTALDEWARSRGE